MTGLLHLVQDLLAEAPNASPEHGALMRQAAAELRSVASAGDFQPQPPPFPPPAIHDRALAGKHQRPLRPAVGMDGAANKNSAHKKAAAR